MTERPLGPPLALAVTALASRSPPSLRVFDRRTDSAWSFGPDGEGPGEIRAAYGVEFVGDTALLVLSGGHRIERFGVRGAYLGGRRLADWSWFEGRRTRVRCRA